MLLTRMLYHNIFNIENKKIEGLWDKTKIINIFLQNMNTPSDLNEMQPRATHLWNCDEIGFDPNGRWKKGVCT